uniref:Uncharacterized protein n=1 Tax=Timema shepardi TaxID=629360 RepID=A0A7R9AM72_TIMSH|nr:unnamed protein product [Timema shepardi]
MASLVLTDSSQLTVDSFKKLPDQITDPYAEPDDLQRHIVCLFNTEPKLRYARAKVRCLKMKDDKISRYCAHLGFPRYPCWAPGVINYPPTTCSEPSNPRRDPGTPNKPGTSDGSAGALTNSPVNKRRGFSG